MKSDADVDALERLIVQLKGLHDEVSLLAKKSPNDALNNFKLGLVNKVIRSGNAILSPSHLPFDDFEQFDVDTVPSNSDVTMILAQYMEQAERFRSENVVYDKARWVYRLNGEPGNSKAMPPTYVGGAKK